MESAQIRVDITMWRINGCGFLVAEGRLDINPIGFMIIEYNRLACPLSLIESGVNNDQSLSI